MQHCNRSKKQFSTSLILHESINFSVNKLCVDRFNVNTSCLSFAHKSVVIDRFQFSTHIGDDTKPVAIQSANL